MLRRWRDGSLTRFELAVLAVVVAGSVLRLWGLGWRQLWYDEIFSWLVARGSWAALWAATAGDVHPPLYYALLKVSIVFLGDAEWALRLPSAVLSIVGLALTWPLARSFNLSERESLVAVTVMAFAPFQVQYAHEARMYAMLQVLTIGLLLAINGRRWGVAALLCAAGAWTHTYAILFGASVYALALAREVRRPVHPTDGSPAAEPSRVMFSAGAAALLYSPWAVALAHQVSNARADWWQQPTTPGAIAQTVYHLIFGQTLWDWPMMLGGLWALVVFIGAATGRRDLGLKWLTIATPVMALVIEIFYRPIWLPRAMMVVSAPAYLLLGRYLAFDRSRVSIGALGIIPAILGAMMAPYGSPWFSMTNQPLAAIAPFIQPGDSIYHADEGSWVLFSRYGQFAGVNQFLLPIPQRPLGGLTPATLRALSIRESAPGSNISASWVIYFAGPMARETETETVKKIVVDRYPLWRWTTDMYDGAVWYIPAEMTRDPCSFSICLSAGPN